MVAEYCIVEESPALSGRVMLGGAKNAVLPIMASLILTSGTSTLTNVPASADVYQMITLLQDLGAHVVFEALTGTLHVDTSALDAWSVKPEIMKKMRASVLVMGPLLARHKKVCIALPGGCSIGARPIDLHLKIFEQMGVSVGFSGEYLQAEALELCAVRFVLDYPSVGATENALMAAVLTCGITEIVNAAIEPEVLDLIDVLKKMGARIAVDAPATIRIEGVSALKPIEHHIMADRLEAGTLLLAASVTKGHIVIPDAPAYAMELFLQKLSEMGNKIIVGENGIGITLIGADVLKPISFITMPYPGFPTDLQAPMMAACAVASGTSYIHETVFENRMLHTCELKKMGAAIAVKGNRATVKGVSTLHGAEVLATDIRASAALVIAGLAAKGRTKILEVHHLKRGYSSLDQKITQLGGVMFFEKKSREGLHFLQNSTSKVSKLTSNE